MARPSPRILEETRREVAGIDHSPEAVKTARSVNRAAVSSGRLRIVESSVESLPLRDGFFDVVTAFETTYFWPDLQAGLTEIHRVVNRGGKLVIANEFADRASAGAWADRLNMHVPDSEALAGAAYEAGFLMVDCQRPSPQRLAAPHRCEVEAHSSPTAHESGAAPGGPARCRQRPGPP